MKKAVVLFLLLAILCGCTQTTQAPELLEPVKVETDKAVALYGEIYNITMYEATIKPEVTGLSFSRSGRVDECYYALGDTVKTGDVIAVLDTARQRDEAEALKQEIENLTQNAEIERQRAQLEIELYKSRGASALEQAQIEQKQALARQESERAALELSELETKLGEALQLIAASNLIAEFDGTIISMSIKNGSRAAEGVPVLYVADDSTMIIVTEYLRSDELNSADRVYASIGGVEYDVTNVPYDRSELVTLTASGAELRSTFTIDAPTDEIHNGMFTCVYIRKDYVPNTLVIPSVALKKDAAGTFVYLMTDDGQTRRDVEPGVQTDALIEILGGLEEGDVVFVGS